MLRGEQVWHELAEAQAGVLSRGQLGQLGLSPSSAERHVTGHRWQRVFPGVYATFTGPLPDLSRVWAGVLYGGADAHASHETALQLFGLLDHSPEKVHVMLPANRRVRRQPGLVVHISRGQATRRHPAGAPPRIRLEDTILDVAAGYRAPEPVLSLVFTATQRRMTTAGRLRHALVGRARHRWRRLLHEVLDDVADGVASPLERRYAHEVERPHGLPHGIRNAPERAPGGGAWYRDVRYDEHALIVELDGREAHPAEQRFRDLRRDNQAVASGRAVLRFGWHDVTGRPCATAAQVAFALGLRGWRGTPSRCGPACSLPTRATS